MVPENCYVNQRELEPFPFGIRIDYVLYKVSLRVSSPTASLSFTSFCLLIFCPASLDLRSLMPAEWGEALKDVSGPDFFIGGFWLLHLL